MVRNVIPAHWQMVGNQKVAVMCLLVAAMLPAVLASNHVFQITDISCSPGSPDTGDTVSCEFDTNWDGICRQELAIDGPGGQKTAQGVSTVFRPSQAGEYTVTAEACDSNMLGCHTDSCDTQSTSIQVGSGGGGNECQTDSDCSQKVVCSADKTPACNDQGQCFCEEQGGGGSGCVDECNQNGRSCRDDSAAIVCKDLDQDDCLEYKLEKCDANNCQNGYCQGGGGGQCNNDGNCDPGETANNCPNDCPDGGGQCDYTSLIQQYDANTDKQISDSELNTAAGDYAQEKITDAQMDQIRQYANNDCGGGSGGQPSCTIQTTPSNPSTGQKIDVTVQYSGFSSTPTVATVHCPVNSGGNVYQMRSCSGSPSGSCGPDSYPSGNRCQFNSAGNQGISANVFSSGTDSASCNTSISVAGGGGNQCGNGVIDAGEQCDGTNLNGKTCSDFGFSGGQLTCNQDCTFNKTACTQQPSGRQPPCGNKGDVNTDGRITTNDANKINQFLENQIQLGAEQLRRAEVDGDGSLTVQDVALVASYAQGNRNSFPVCSSSQQCSSGVSGGKAQPNPASSQTTFSVNADCPRGMSVIVFDSNGQRVWNSGRQMDTNRTTWNLQDLNGNPVSNGQYYWRIDIAHNNSQGATEIGNATGTLTVNRSGGQQCDNDGVKEQGEQCDGNDFGTKSCSDFGFSGGDLTCTDDCRINTTLCTGGGNPNCKSVGRRCQSNSDCCGSLECKQQQAGPEKTCQSPGSGPVIPIPCTGQNCRSSSYSVMETRDGWSTAFISSKKPIPLDTLKKQCKGFLALGLKNGQLGAAEGALKPKESYLIRASQSCNVQVQFPQTSITDVTLSQGWNLQGFGSTLSVSALQQAGCGDPAVFKLEQGQLASVEGTLRPNTGYLIRVDQQCSISESGGDIEIG